MQAAGYPAMTAAARFTLRRSFDWKWVVIGLCVALTVYIAVIPLAFLLWQSFFTPQTAAKAAEFTLGNYTSVYGLHYSPMAFLLMTAAFRAMDPALEESATMSGANIFQVAWRVTLKLTWPAILATLLMLFVRAIESFEVPALLGLPVGIHVFTSAIYQAVHRYPSQ